MNDDDLDPDSSGNDELGPDSSALDQYLGGGLAGKGYAFEAAGKKYGVDPTLLASIATLESGHGTSRATMQYNNPVGMMDPKSPGQKQFPKYPCIDDAIDATASNLSRNYLQKGLSTIAQIGAKYSEPGDANDPKHTNAQWPDQVQQIYAKMGGTRTDFGPQQDEPEDTDDGNGGYDQSFQHLGGYLGAVNA
jgi:beta-N-acetylglucosaminidase